MVVNKISGNEVKEKIVDVAARLFAEKGYDAVSIREIAEAVGVTKPAIYYYFDGKKDLHDHLIVQGFEMMHRHIREAVKFEEEPEEKLLAAINAHLSYCGDNINTMKSIYQCILESTEHTSLSRQSFKIMEDIFIEAQVQGKFLKGNPRDLSIALMGILNIYLMRQLVVQEKMLTEELALKILNMIS